MQLWQMPVYEHDLNCVKTIALDDQDDQVNQFIYCVF